ncbi:MAG: GtrA family protein [Chloroflexia bacterium]|nr:GtrA family protein [Chloroflexia bacterium]
MISTESWSPPAVRFWTLAQRFQKFLAVGAAGLMVNQLMLFALRELVALALLIASPLAILVSMIVTFGLNERWTWHDRGRGRILHRAAFYVPINLGGLIINTSVLAIAHEQFGVHYLWANLIGAGIAAIWNFGLNNAITWRE